MKSSKKPFFLWFVSNFVLFFLSTTWSTTLIPFLFLLHMSHPTRIHNFFFGRRKIIQHLLLNKSFTYLYNLWNLECISKVLCKQTNLPSESGSEWTSGPGPFLILTGVFLAASVTVTYNRSSLPRPVFSRSCWLRAPLLFSERKLSWVVFFASRKVTFGHFFRKIFLSAMLSGEFHVDPEISSP